MSFGIRAFVGPYPRGTYGHSSGSSSSWRSRRSLRTLKKRDRRNNCSEMRDSRPRMWHCQQRLNSQPLLCFLVFRWARPGRWNRERLEHRERQQDRCYRGHPEAKEERKKKKGSTFDNNNQFSEHDSDGKFYLDSRRSISARRSVRSRGALSHEQSINTLYNL